MHGPEAAVLEQACVWHEGVDVPALVVCGLLPRTPWERDLHPPTAAAPWVMHLAGTELQGHLYVCVTQCPPLSAGVTAVSLPRAEACPCIGDQGSCTGPMRRHGQVCILALGAQSANHIWPDGCMWQQASTSPCWVGGSQTQLQAATGSTIRQRCSPDPLYDGIQLKSELLATP